MNKLFILPILNYANGKLSPSLPIAYRRFLIFRMDPSMQRYAHKETDPTVINITDNREQFDLRRRMRRIGS